MNQPAVTPTVLIVVNRDSRLEVFQDAGVQVVFSDERADRHSVILLPRQNQAQQLNDRLVDKYVFSPTEDMAGTAVNAIRQLQSLSIITTGLKADKEAS